MVVRLQPTMFYVRARSGMHTARRRFAAPALALSILAAVVAAVVWHSTAAAAAVCTRTATPSTFGASVAAAGTGQTICLTSGDYGTWGGTNKAITITAASGSTPTMQVSFGSGAAGFTLDGISGMGGDVSGGAANITIQNSRFSSQLNISGSVSNIVINHNDLTYPAQSASSGSVAKIFYDASGSSPGSAATIENNDIENGDLDGVQISGGSGLQVVGNVFRNLCDVGANHTDNIQFVGGRQTVIARNYVYEPQSCATQGITSYDGATHGLIIEDNVVDIPRDWGIELYSDQNSVVVHNTVVYHPKSYSEFNSGDGQIDIDRKSQDPAGSGTQVYDNIATSVNFTNGSSGTESHNVSGQRALYVGPTNTYAGFRLAANSPVGLHAASDGLDDGARIAAVSTPPPTTTTSPTTTKPTRPGTHVPSGPRLVAAFTFGEASGSKVVDHSGFHNDGRIEGARRTRFGKHGRALVFDGTDDYVRVPASQSLNLINGMTLSAWVRPVGSRHAWRTVMLKAQGRRMSYGLYASNKRGGAVASVRTRRSYSAGGGIALPRRRWSYLAATYNGIVLKVYVNGALESSRVVRGALGNVRGPLTIGGNRLWRHWFKGEIDDVYVWNGALSAAAIRGAMRF
jgi:Concanavalin A-like lectin/glucanases superfamily/Right handed beta helix region